MLEEGATHLGVATDHVIESFRNDLWETYKDGAGIDPLLKGQFPLLEDALSALGRRRCGRWSSSRPTTRSARAAVVAADDHRVEQVIICTPDKDLGQCVGGKVVQLDRRRDVLLDADGVREKFGVLPESIPDWLALVGDTADGFPGLPGFGAKTAAALLAATATSRRFPTTRRRGTSPGVRGADRLAATLARGPRSRGAVQGARDAPDRRAGGHGRRVGMARPRRRPRRLVQPFRIAETRRSGLPRSSAATDEEARRVMT